MTRIITVLGATGNQGEHLLMARSAKALKTDPCTILGGSVAKLLLQYPNEYKVRAVTRDPNSDAAKALQSKGAEVVRADMTIPSSLPQVLEGCWGVFGVTNFYDGMRSPRIC